MSSPKVKALSILHATQKHERGKEHVRERTEPYTASKLKQHLLFETDSTARHEHSSLSERRSKRESESAWRQRASLRKRESKIKLGAERTNEQTERLKSCRWI